MSIFENPEAHPQQANDFFKVRYKNIKEILEKHRVKLIQAKLNDDSLITIWRNSIIEPDVRFFWHLTLCSMGAFSYTHSRPINGISIGRYCSIASNVRVFGATHYTDWISTSSQFYSRRFVKSELPLTFEERSCNKIKIGNDVWIGSDVALARGITIGTGAVVATGAIVTKDVEPFMVVGGVPARPIKQRFSEKTKERINLIKWWNYKLADFEGMNADSPSNFLNNLEEKISNNSIEPWQPETLMTSDLEKFSIQ